MTTAVIDELSKPAELHAAITPSDSTNFTRGVCRGIWVGTGGDISIVDKHGNTAVWKNVPNGTLLPIRALRVNSTGTVTASDMLALY
jgi:hypothetical protein